VDPVGIGYYQQAGKLLIRWDRQTYVALLPFCANMLLKLLLEKTQHIRMALNNGFKRACVRHMSTGKAAYTVVMMRHGYVSNTLGANC
jgi:hypothetical protein